VIDTHRLVARLDRWQQLHRGPAFLIAVLLRYREDRGRDFAALLSYYGFISLFPLLLVLVTVLGIVLENDPDLRNRIVDTVFSRIPVVGEQLRQSTTGLSSSGWILLVGLLVAIWSGLVVVRRAQDAFNLQWGVPRFQRPSFLATQLRALGAMTMVGIGIVVATATTSLASSFPSVPWEGRLLGAAIAIVVNVAVLTVTFQVLTQSAVRWGDLYAGGVVGGVGLWAVQLIGATYVSRVVMGASDVYGSFAVVLGLLVWIALLARLTLFANEMNVVRANHFWPRSMTATSLTDADHRAIEHTAHKEALLR
jgi:inner membrane protein YhjD